MGYQESSDPTSTNVGLQFFDPADSLEVNRRFVGIRPVGIYSGGWLHLSGSTATISGFIAEVRDGDNQVRVSKTADTTVSSATANKYIVMRWAAPSGSATWPTFLAVSSTDAGDIVFGRVNSGGSDVTHVGRTVPASAEYNLKVVPGAEKEPGTPKSVIVLGGTAVVGNSQYTVTSTWLSLTGTGTAYIYIDASSGAVLSTTSLATATLNLVLAKVALVTTITADDITDLRMNQTGASTALVNSLTRGLFAVKEYTTVDTITTNLDETGRRASVLNGSQVGFVSAFNLSYTPKFVGSIVEVEALINIGVGNGDVRVVGGLFESNSVLAGNLAKAAFVTGPTGVGSNDTYLQLVLRYYKTIASLSAFTVYVGLARNQANAWLNGRDTYSGSNALYTGAVISSIRIRENPSL